MRKLIMLLIACSVFSDAWTQDKTMFGEYSTYWSYYLSSPDSHFFLRNEPNGYFELLSYGSMTINGKVYHPVYMDIATAGARGKEPSSYYYFPIHESRMVMAIREEGGRILADVNDYLEYWRGNRIIGPFGQTDPDHFSYPVTVDGEVVLYDFNMQVGDKFPEREGQKTVFVESIETITCKDDTERKLFHLSNGCDIIEGIGAVNGAGFLFDYLNECTRMYVVQYLYTFRKDLNIDQPLEECLPLSTVVFSCNFEDAIEHSKDAIEHYLDIRPLFGENVLGGTNTYDLYGRHLTSNPQKGLYICGGKKYVVK